MHGGAELGESEERHERGEADRQELNLEGGREGEREGGRGKRGRGRES